MVMTLCIEHPPYEVWREINAQGRKKNALLLAGTKITRQTSRKLDLIAS